jgi:lipid-A-disaccharide synthase
MKIFISAGESSGDIYGGLLAKSLKMECPDITLTGLGGSNMAEAGITLLRDMTDLAVTGFVEVLGHLQEFYHIRSEVIEHIKTQNPDLIVMIDYPGFHFALIKALAPLKVPIIYYVSPQVWAWHKRRIHIMREHLAKVLVIFPFEEEFFRQSGVPVEFVGHPLMDILPENPPESPELVMQKEGFDPSKPLLTLLPGSRYNEIKRMFPVMSKTVEKIRKHLPALQVLVPVASTIKTKHFRGLYNPDNKFIFRQNTPSALKQCSAAALTASGTATIENAILGIPMVIMYRLAPISYWLAKGLVKVSHIGMVNLVINERLCEEYIQDQAIPEVLAESILKIIKEPGVRDKQIQGFKKVRELCGGPGASKRAARAILQFKI